MTYKATLAAALIVGPLMAALPGTALAGGNYYGSPQHPYGGHSHVELGPADANEDFAFYNCRWLRDRALHTELERHWRAYRKCARRYGQ